MKGITFILSILILFLSLNPCSDGNNPEDKNDDKISINHNHQEDHDDSCSVICICNCCGMAITHELINPFGLIINPDISTLIYSEYHSNYRFDFLSNIWQPPKLIN